MFTVMPILAHSVWRITAVCCVVGSPDTTSMDILNPFGTDDCDSCCFALVKSYGYGGIEGGHHLVRAPLRLRPLPSPPHTTQLVARFGVGQFLARRPPASPSGVALCLRACTTAPKT